MEARADMIEKVARAIYDELYKDSMGSVSYKDDWLEMRSQFMGEARAAIEATPLDDLIVFYHEFKETVHEVTLPHSEADELLSRINAALTEHEERS